MDSLKRKVTLVVALVDAALKEPSVEKVHDAKVGAADLLPRLRRLLLDGTASAATVNEVAQLNAMLLALRWRLDGASRGARN